MILFDVDVEVGLASVSFARFGALRHGTRPRPDLEVYPVVVLLKIVGTC